MKTSDKFRFDCRAYLATCFTNQKTFTLILTWLSKQTSGNGMSERQHSQMFNSLVCGN